MELSFRSPKINQLLVETEAVRRVSDICERMGEEGISSRYYFLGHRGYGKSTLLNYMAYLLYQKSKPSRVLPVYCTMRGQMDDQHGMEFVFFDSLLSAMFGVPSDAVTMGFSEEEIRVVGRLTTAQNEYRAYLKEHGGVTVQFVREAFENQVVHLTPHFRPIVFLVDGLDKYDPKSVLTFLRRSQEYFNSLMVSYNCVFVYSADPTWVETLDSDEFSGVKGIQIGLRRWNADEAYSLVKKRLEDVGIFTCPFGPESIEALVESCSGNPRRILQDATTILRYAARQHETTIGPGIVRSVLWTEEEKNTLLDLVNRDPEFRYGYEKLKSCISDRQFLRILIATHEHDELSRSLGYQERANKGITLEDKDFKARIDQLVNRGCLRHGVKEGSVALEDDVRMLMDHVTKKELPFDSLPAIFDEFESKVKPAPAPKETTLVLEAVKDVFQENSTKWLSTDEISQLIMDNPRRADILRNRFGSETESKLQRLVPMLAGSLRSNSIVIYDSSSAKYRLRGSRLEVDIVEVVRHKEELEEFERAQYALDNNDLAAVRASCKTALVVSLSRLMHLLQGSFNISKLERSIRLLDRLRTGDKRPLTRGEPLALKELLKTVSREKPIDSDTAKVIVQMTRLYLKRLHMAIIQIEEQGLDLRPKTKLAQGRRERKAGIQVNSGL
mgnify:CR=1 FL=1